MAAPIVGFLVVAVLVGELVYELKTGRLLGRSWKVYGRREENAMLYWSSIGLRVFVTLLVCGIVVMVVLGLRN